MWEAPLNSEQSGPASFKHVALSTSQRWLRWLQQHWPSSLCLLQDGTHGPGRPHVTVRGLFLDLHGRQLTSTDRRCRCLLDSLQVASWSQLGPSRLPMWYRIFCNAFLSLFFFSSSLQPQTFRLWSAAVSFSSACGLHLPHVKQWFCSHSSSSDSPKMGDMKCLQ